MLRNDKLKDLSVEKLLEELDYCGCDTYYLDYRNIVIAEIKNRLYRFYFRTYIKIYLWNNDISRTNNANSTGYG